MERLRALGTPMQLLVAAILVTLAALLSSWLIIL